MTRTFVKKTLCQPRPRSTPISKSAFTHVCDFQALPRLFSTQDSRAGCLLAFDFSPIPIASHLLRIIQFFLQACVSPSTDQRPRGHFYRQIPLLQDPIPGQTRLHPSRHRHMLPTIQIGLLASPAACSRAVLGHGLMAELHRRLRFITDPALNHSHLDRPPSPTRSSRSPFKEVPTGCKCAHTNSSHSSGLNVS